MRLQDELQRREDELRRKEELFRQQQRDFRGIDKKICTYRSACLSFVIFVYTGSSFCYSVYSLQLNLNIVKGQGTDKIHLPLLSFIISGFFYIYFTITGVKNIVS